MDKRNGGGKFFVGFLIGAIAGAVTAAVLSQEEARNRLAGKAREARGFAAEATGDLRQKVGGVTSQLQSSVTDLYQRGRQFVDGARSNFDAAVADGRMTAQQTRDELQRKAEE